MSIYLFHTLSLLFITCCICGCICSDVIATSDVSKSIEIFKIEEEIKDILKVNGENNSDNNDDGKITAKSFYSPLIVAADDVMVALTGVNRTADDDNKHVDILTKYIKTKEGDDWLKKVTNGGDGWKTQFAYQETVENENKNAVKGLAAAAKEKNIYLLLLNKTEKGGSDTNCGIQLVEGTASDKENGISIEWETKSDVAKSFNEKLKNCLTAMQPNNYLSASSVYLAEEKKIVFVLHGRSGDDNNNKKIYTFISLDDTTKSNVELLCEGTVEGKCYFAFFPWGGKIIMIPTLCGDNSEEATSIHKSNNMGKMLTDSVEPFGRLLGFMREKSDFTTTKINNISVVLFTQEKPKATGDSGSQKKFDVHLWFTDGNRVSTAGIIAADDSVAFSNLLHTNEKLFALHEIIKDTQETITLSYLEKQLRNITTVIDSWKKCDDVVKKLFTDTSSGTGSIIDGLVGFLSNRSADNKKEWIDEYLYVNATVNKGNKVDNGGFYFSENGSGAKWPVGKSKEDQPYNFTDPGFTLVANVTIGTVSAAQNNNSLLGVGLNDNKRVGLWCTTEGKWGVSGDEEAGFKQTSKNDCKKNREYHVALVYLDSKLSVYVDWEELKELAIQNTNTQQFKNITHFYFGADESQKDVESNVTVRNVLLYNRPFTENEIAKLKKAKNTNMEKNDKVDKEHPKKENDKNTNGQSDVGIAGGGGNNGGENTTHENTTNNNNGNSGEEEENLTSQSEVSMVRRALSLLMLSLLLLLLDVFWVGVLL